MSYFEKFLHLFSNPFKRGNTPYPRPTSSSKPSQASEAPHQPFPILLASQSPSRQRQLKQLGLSFQWMNHTINEEIYKKNNTGSARDLSLTLATEKALSVKNQHPHAIIIGGDQILTLEHKIFSKAKSEKDFRKQLEELSGKSHYLFSAMSLFHPEQGLFSYCEESYLTMKNLTEAQIQRFCAKEYSPDYLGYKLEERGMSLFTQIKCQDFSAIFGLPLLKLNAILTQWGFSIP